ncbi:MAG: beta-ketoacyl-ACP synthase II [Gaiellaceae bacterium]
MSKVTHNERRIVVTGIGMVTALGPDRESTWQGLMKGESPAGPITLFDPARVPVDFACEASEFDASVALDKKTIRRTDRYAHMAVAATRAAVDDAELEIGRHYASERIGTSIASGMGGLETLERTLGVLNEFGADRVNPFALPALIPNMAAALVSIELGTTGPLAAASTACAASSMGMADAALYIRAGMADAMLVGGTEAVVNLLAIAGFAASRALSTRTDDPARASRPFDLDRDGFVMGEGASTLVLEELTHAEARGATIYAELLGFGLSSDAAHITAIDPTGEHPARAVRNALNDAGVEPGEIGYVNAHATSTQVGDAGETKVMKHVFGEEGARAVPISSTKSMTGHMFGAAGATEAAITVLALTRGMLPPTINYETPDPECDLDYIPNEARAADVDIAISTGFAFGGHNACLVFRRWDGPSRRRS